VPNCKQVLKWLYTTLAWVHIYLSLRLERAVKQGLGTKHLEACRAFVAVPETGSVNMATEQIPTTITMLQEPRTLPSQINMDL